MTSFNYQKLEQCDYSSHELEQKITDRRLAVIVRQLNVLTTLHGALHWFTLTVPEITLLE